jgi:hypothetical protein
MNFLQTVLLALLANPLVFQQAIIPSRGSSSVNVGLSRDTPSITDLFAGRSAPSQRSPAWLGQSALAFPVDNRGQLLGAGQFGVRQIGKFAFHVVGQFIAPALSNHFQRVQEC